MQLFLTLEVLMSFPCILLLCEFFRDGKTQIGKKYDKINTQHPLLG